MLYMYVQPGVRNASGWNLSVGQLPRSLYIAPGIAHGRNWFWGDAHSHWGANLAYSSGWSKMLEGQYSDENQRHQAKHSQAYNWCAPPGWSLVWNESERAGRCKNWSFSRSKRGTICRTVMRNLIEDGRNDRLARFREL